MDTRRPRQWNVSVAKSSPVEPPVVSIYTGNNLYGDSEPSLPPPTPIPAEHTLINTASFAADQILLCQRMTGIEPRTGVTLAL